MEETPTQILKRVNDLKHKHESLKKEILDDVSIIEEKQKIVNKKVENLNLIEEEYVSLMGQLSEF